MAPHLYEGWQKDMTLHRSFFFDMYRFYMICNELMDSWFASPIHEHMEYQFGVSEGYGLKWMFPNFGHQFLVVQQGLLQPENHIASAAKYCSGLNGHTVTTVHSTQVLPCTNAVLCTRLAA
jgi:hypothetical protein